MPNTLHPENVTTWLGEARQHLAHAENALVAAALAADWRTASAISLALDAIEKAGDRLPTKKLN